MEYLFIKNDYLVMNNARDTNYFTNFFTNCWYGEWSFAKWKNDINGGPRWKPIKGWPHQHFVKIL